MARFSSALTTLENLLSNEYNHDRKMRATIHADDLHNDRVRLLAHLREVGRSGDLEWIVAAEKTIVESDLARYANSKAMTHSLESALDDLAIIEKHMLIVADKSLYRFLDETHRRPKNRKNGLPLDEAREALASHRTRLDNMDKSRLDEDEKSIVDARKDAMKKANDLYIALQKNALGMDDQAQQAQEQKQEQTQTRPRGRGR
ncbi:MAG: hypothetical protein IKU14_00895 [Rhodocyclaceae bacterium]|nr:hypothetical protein [Rhodocyclaceae bacterium]